MSPLAYCIFLLFGSSQRRVESVTQTVTKQVEAEHQQADKDRGEEDHVGKKLLKEMADEDAGE